uniref:Uncharacterized protein n=1 Tax=viral metagenome TaxID=1070528 RepID=A0A6C0C0F8_9ZZZZ
MALIISEDTETFSMHRHLQMLLDRSFWCSIRMYDIDEPLLLDELRMEAALRVWVRQLDTKKNPPSCMPDDAALKCFGHDLDGKYGIDEWWEWPAWSTCQQCNHSEATLCSECQQLMKFTTLYNCDTSSDNSSHNQCCQ